MMLPGRRLAEDICYSMLHSATVSLDRSNVTRKGDKKTEVPRGLLLERSFGSRWLEAVRCVPSMSALHSLSGSPCQCMAAARKLGMDRDGKESINDELKTVSQKEKQFEGFKGIT